MSKIKDVSDKITEGARGVSERAIGYRDWLNDEGKAKALGTLAVFLAKASQAGFNISEKMLAKAEKGDEPEEESTPNELDD